MEFISKPTLSEIYLFNEIGHNSINRIFNSIEKVLDTFYGKKHVVEDCPTWIYSAKTNSRIENLSKIEFLGDNLKINKMGKTDE